MCTSFTHLFVFRLVIKMKQNTHKVSKSLGETEIEIVSVYYICRIELDQGEKTLTSLTNTLMVKPHVDVVAIENTGHFTFLFNGYHTPSSIKYF